MLRPALIAALLVPAAATLCSADASDRLARIDPLLRPEHVFPTSALPGLPQIDPADETTPLRATLRLEGAIEEQRALLRRRGLRFLPGASGAPLSLGGIHGVEAPLPLLRSLALEGWSLWLARPTDTLHPPTAVTGPEIEMDALWASGSTPRGGLLGQGMTVLDIDSGIDPFHPHFFRADGGVFAWLDVDGDGILSPGTDGVDLDGDGRIEEAERLLLFNRWSEHRDVASGTNLLIGRDELLDPASDWLWLDEDGDGERNYGSGDGYTDDDPGLGEWLLVPDDANGDGLIEQPERLLLLGSSRIAAVRDTGGTYRRGENLVDMDPGVPADDSHGTAVGGILVGGQLPGQRPGGGLLPEAPRLRWDDYGADGLQQLLALDWAREERADVVLHEFGGWIGQPLDGSSIYEGALDTLVEGGIVNVCPAGNLGTSGKHGVATMSGGQIRFHLRVESWIGDISYLAFDLHSLDAPALACELSSPSGERLTLPQGGAGGAIDGLDSYGTQYSTSRGTSLWSFSLYSDTATLEPGLWLLDCTADDEVDRELHAYLADGYSWGRGVYFLQEDDRSNMTEPSTADSCIAVGAYGVNSLYWNGEEPGERHRYSGKGPRINGGRTIDVAAPADAFAPAPTKPDEPLLDAGYQLFGGTSGAGPHVTAVATLLRQADPEVDALEIRRWLQEGALVDEVVAGETTALPDDAWGFGKLRGYRALTGEPPEDGPSGPASVSPIFEAMTTDGRCVVTVDATVEGVPEALLRYDLGYDGQWETDFAATSYELDAAPGDEILLRIEAADGGWRVGGLATTWTVPDPCRTTGAGCRSCASLASRDNGGDGEGLNASLGLLLIGVLLRRRSSA